MKYVRPKIMGILNVTPDSFSDGGKFQNTNIALQQAWQMILDGADIIDIGGESSRPGSLRISWEEEWDRIKEIVSECVKLNAVISVDTYKPEVAERALEQGVQIINDITGLGDRRLRKIIAKYNATGVIMHMQGNPETMQDSPQYVDVIAEITEYFEGKIIEANSDGVSKIILDPGIGFGKRLNDNIEIVKNVDRFVKIGYPLLFGFSRKSFLGKITGEEEAINRDLETHLTTFRTLNKNISIYRVHDVRGTVRTIDLYQAISRDTD